MDHFTYTKISVLIPFHGDEPWRKESLEWVRKRWNLQLSALNINHEVIVNEDDADDFNKCRAINNAAREATGDLYILSDADVFLSDVTLKKALMRISHIDNYYTYPYKRVERLNQEITRRYYDNGPDSAIIHRPEHVQKKHVDTGGIILVDADGFYQVRGMDERFNSVYGGEMVSFSTSMKKVFKPVNRIQDDLYHLWHPKFDRAHKKERQPNKKLWGRYKHARGIGDMLRIINEREKL